VRRGAASQDDAKATAAAAIASYEQLAGHVARIIGHDGVTAIYGRSLHLTQKEFPWLPAADKEPVPLEQLRAILEGQHSSVVALAVEALVVNFADLLVALVGDQLTMRVFEDAWPDGFSGESGQEGTE
jgi:hypothetical protein